MRRYSSSRKKNSTKIFIAATALIAVVFGAYTYFNGVTNEVVIAKVNNQKIFKSDIERKLRDVFDGSKQEIKAPEVEKLPQEVLEILVKEIYLEKELTKEAKKSAATHNQETKDKINEAKSRILRQVYVESILKTEVTDEKISEKYAELTNEIAGKKEYQIAHILVKSKEEAEKLSQELKSKKAPKFSDLARKHSVDKESADKGGDLGYVLEDNIVKEIADSLKDMKNGEVSAPIQSKFGWHLVKLFDSKEAKALPFETVKENLRDQLIQDKISELNSRITKDLNIELLIRSENKDEVKKEEKSEENTTTENEVAEEAAIVENPAQEPIAEEEKPAVSENASEAPKEEVKKEEVKKEEKKVEKKKEAKKSDKKKSASKKSNDKHKKQKSNQS